MLRGAETGKTITAGSANEMAAKLSEMGLGLRGVFFKSIDYEFYMGYLKLGKVHASFRDGKLNLSKYIEPDFALLTRIHEIAEGNAAEPIAIVKRNESEIAGVLTGYIEGGSLDSLYRRARQTMDHGLVMAYVRNVKKLEQVVKRLHASGVYHQDLNGSNIRIDRNGTLKLIDPLALDPEYSIKTDDKWLERHRNSAARLRSLLEEEQLKSVRRSA